MASPMNRGCLKGSLFRWLCITKCPSFSVTFSLSPSHIYCTILLCLWDNHSAHVWVMAVVCCLSWGYNWPQAFRISFVRDWEFHQSMIMEVKTLQRLRSKENAKIANDNDFWYRFYTQIMSIRIINRRQWRRLFGIIRWLGSARLF
jgi:hypothetical protein